MKGTVLERKKPSGAFEKKVIFLNTPKIWEARWDNENKNFHENKLNHP